MVPLPDAVKAGSGKSGSEKKDYRYRARSEIERWRSSTVIATWKMSIMGDVRELNSLIERGRLCTIILSFICI